MISNPLKQPYALSLSLFAFVMFLLFGGYLTQLANQSALNDKRLFLSSIGRAQAAILERKLSIAFTSIQILTHEIEQNNGAVIDFERTASNIMMSIGEVDSLQVAPDGIIQKIYPLKGNEAAIGLNILANPNYFEAAMMSIDKHQLIAIGPVPLVQGGDAIIGRAPVFLQRNTDKEKFWGFTSAVINLNSLLAATDLKLLESEGYRYLLSRQHADTHETIKFAQSKLPISGLIVHIDIPLPVGLWTLSLSQNVQSDLTQHSLSGYIISLVIATLLAIAIYMTMLQPLKLRRQIKEKTAALQNLAYKDPLTGLPNRRYLKNYLPNIIYKSLAKKHVSAFVYFDLDNFKQINDTIGHDVGDRVLEIVAKRLNNLCHSKDKVVRLGGDEFGILFDNIEGKTQAEELAHKILAAIRLPLKMDSQEFFLSTSLGVAMIPEHGEDLATVMQHADMALYDAKLSGKNQFAFYHAQMKERAINLASAEADIAHALANQEFELYFQPQFNLTTKAVFGAEALIRWNHPERGMVFPDQFIPLAEHTGQIIDIGYWVLENAMAYLARREQQGRPRILLHINLSALQLADKNLLSQVKQLLKKYQTPTECLGFEVTETALLDDIIIAKHLLQSFKDMGICIAIDDFGVGYSSLGQLKNLPVDLLKIDRSFIIDLATDANDKKIVEAIIAMSHKLGMEVIAEGIEEQTQWDILSSVHCDFGQGYMVSKPVEEARFNEII